MLGNIKCQYVLLRFIDDRFIVDRFIVDRFIVHRSIVDRFIVDRSIAALIGNPELLLTNFVYQLIV